MGLRCLAQTPRPSPYEFRYNEAVPEELGARIRPAGAAGQQALVVLIGNSKLVWEPFLAACAPGPDSLLASDNPFDTYVVGAVEAALAKCADG